MKKTYEKPKVEVELFSLSQNIAACSEKVLFGPKGEDKACGTFFPPTDPFALENSVQSNARVQPFYDNDSCKCYYTAPRESGYFSS